MDFNLQPNVPFEAPRAAPDFSPAAARHTEQMERLRTYVGPRWQSHYRDVFEDLLKAQSGSDAPLTWNWAALFPAWFLYRRLYAVFAGLVVARFFLWPFMIAGAGTSVGHGATLAYLAMLVGQAWGADRLLFDRAIAAGGEIRDPARLARAGQPLMAAIWIPTVLAFHLFAPAISYFLFFYEPEPAPPPVVEAAPLPPVAREVRSADGKLALTVPYHWEPVAGLRDGARIEAGSRSADHYLVVMTENREDLPAGTDPERHVRAAVEGLRGKMEIESASDPKRIIVGPRPAARIEVLGTENGRRMMYFVTSVEEGEHFHTVMAWTPITGADSTRTIYRHVLHTLREYEP